MRRIKYIVLHCTGSHLDNDHRDIIKWFHERNTFKIPKPPYHYMINKYGVVYETHPIHDPSYGAKGFNRYSIHVATVGGLAGDDRTTLQIRALRTLVYDLHRQFPDAEVLGHRDFPNDRKLCPQYDAREWWAEEKLVLDALKNL